jgi:hypothetical protein
MLLGPAVLIVLRIYLQIYVEHQRRLHRIAQLMPGAQAPILTPDKNPLLRGFRGFTFYLLLPLAMLAFWWKAAVFPEWGQAFAIVAAAVIAMHLTILLRRLSWIRRAVISLAVTWAMAVTVSFGISFRRPFNLFRANLADQYLTRADLTAANLADANLADANLTAANLTRAVFFYSKLARAELARADLTAANLWNANLTGANLLLANLTRADLTAANLADANLGLANLTSGFLWHANLTGANLFGANLTGANLADANLTGANLTDANLTDANLTRADGLAQQQLDTACGNARTRLPTGLSVKFCSQH